jgi:hypothetical protein
MKCEACGQEFLTTHSCNGPIQAAAEPENPHPQGFALFHYLAEAWRIVRWDDAAIRRVKDDPRVLPYGILIWLLANAIPFLLLVYLWAKKPSNLTPERVLFAFATALLYGAILGLVQIGIVHLIAKYFCGGDGDFIQLLRPLLLASFIYILQAIPVAGTLIAGLAWVCVMVMVFDVVDGMSQLTTFFVSGAVGVGLRILATSIHGVRF